MSPPLHLKGGMLVSPTGTRRADVLAIGGIIVAISDGLALPQGTVTLDVSGLYVLPGMIDPHTHFWEDGFAADPDFRDGSLSAICGGVTTIIDMPLTEPCVLDVATLQDKVTLGRRTSLTDFSLFGGVGPKNREALEPLWNAGVVGLKIFTCYTGCAMEGLTTDQDLGVALAEIARFDGLACLHAEDEQRLIANYMAQLASDQHDVAAFLAWHDEESELIAIRRILKHAEAYGTRVNFVHVTSPSGLTLVSEAQAAGVAATAETCPHYLFLSAADVQRQGPYAVCAPPVRSGDNLAEMHLLLGQGAVFTIGTDHCAVLPDRKNRPALEAQPGFPGLETMVPLLLELVARGVLTLEQLVAVASTNTARLYGLYPRKGTIAVGSDADFTVVDPNHVWTIDATGLVGSAGWTPYQGLTVQGRVVMTIIRGRLVAREGRVLDVEGQAEFIPRGGRAARPSTQIGK